MGRRTTPPANTTVSAPAWLPEPFGASRVALLMHDTARHLIPGGTGPVWGELTPVGAVFAGDLGPLQRFRGNRNNPNVVLDPPIALPGTNVPSSNPVFDQLFRAAQARGR